MTECNHILHYNKPDNTWECEKCEFWINKIDMDWIEKEFERRRLND